MTQGSYDEKTHSCGNQSTNVTLSLSKDGKKEEKVIERKHQHLAEQSDL